MALHIPVILGKLALGSKAATAAKTATATGAKIGATAAKGKTSAGIGLKIATFGLISANVIFIAWLAHKQKLFCPPSKLGAVCHECENWISVDDLAKNFVNAMPAREFVFSGICPHCKKHQDIPSSQLREKK